MSDFPSAGQQARDLLDRVRDAENILPGTLASDITEELSRLRAQETRIRKLAERAATVRAWSEPDGPTCDEANARNELGEDILSALDTEGEQ
ncbi:hypothetical protein HUFFLYPUFF_45 [Mycobacterium phage HufflyPuff]|uniref:hypothetical protein n=1 Tax=Mycobacterium phage HufflyPuff TaxID=1430411 RepID=UPI0003C961E3|nr:hypothetical protein HUFFLYPUFF_45 [Mycobacterium phage HufflyPuff]AHB31213.1 hypothetical protein HUFFLYPUFF_45 [Mycobacterium phage HufflyPuff]AXH68516.1 hypothetical protein SEA_XKCD_47 [Mycobacterium phage xkcd]